MIYKIKKKLTVIHKQFMKWMLLKNFSEIAIFLKNLFAYL